LGFELVVCSQEIPGKITRTTGILHWYIEKWSTIMSDFKMSNQEAFPVGSEPDPASRTSSAEENRSSSGVMSAPSQELRLWRELSGRKVRRVVAASVMGPLLGLAIGLAAASPASAAQPAKGGSNARSAPAPGGSSGTVGSVSKSSFTLTTAAGQKVTVDETSSTKYEKKSKSTSASSVTKGEEVLVLGTVNSTTIKATQITVSTTGGGNSSAATAADVVPFTKGSPTTSKQVGTIPKAYSEGSGTIVSGTTANKATEAALAAYPGGIVDRVVKLSNGDYEVHNIGVNWPHHIFVNQDFKVIGAE
jgi:hypothetical protein